MSLNDSHSSSFQSPSPRLDLNRTFTTPPVTQLLFTSSQSGHYLESVDRTAALDHTVDSPEHFSVSPAPTPQDHLDRLSALVGIRGTLVNPFFELPLFVQAARGPLMPLLHIFSESVLTELLENCLDQYLTFDTSSHIFSARASVRHVFPSPSAASPSSVLLVSPTVPQSQAPASDSLRDILVVVVRNQASVNKINN